MGCSWSANAKTDRLIRLRTGNTTARTPVGHRLFTAPSRFGYSSRCPGGTHSCKSGGKSKGCPAGRHETWSASGVPTRNWRIGSYFPLRKSTHNPSAINFAARTFLRRTLLADEWADMADGDEGGDDGVRNRVLNQDEIDSLLGFDSGADDSERAGIKAIINRRSFPTSACPCLRSSSTGLCG